MHKTGFIGLHDRWTGECNPVTPVECIQTELIWCLPNEFDTTNLLICLKFAICCIALLNLGETCHLKDAVAYFIIAMLIRYDVMRFELVLWRNTMHEWVMNIHYQTWKAQGRFINISRTPSKLWGMCDNIPHFPGHVIKYPCWHWNQAMLVKGSQLAVMTWDYSMDVSSKQFKTLRVNCLNGLDFWWCWWMRWWI